MTLVNIDLARVIDKALNISLFTRINHIFRREGLTLIAISGVIGTIISSIFALIFGIKNATSPGPQSGPGPQPTPEPTIVDKIKEFIISSLKKIAEIFKKIAVWAAAILPAGLIGSIVSWLFDKVAAMVTFLAEHVFIVIMLLLGLGFRFIINYLNKKEKKLRK